MKILMKLRAAASALAKRTCNIDEINSPGTFIEHRWGTLFRVPEGALQYGVHPRRKRVGRELWLVTRLTKDPETPVEKARWIAANLGLHSSRWRPTH